MTDNASPDVELDRVVKTFGDHRATDSVSLRIRRGETVAMLGPSGCGKTTILRLIAGFEKPDAGRVLLSGRDMSDREPFERSIGLIFQHYALFPHMNVMDNVEYGLVRRGVPKAERKERVSEMLGIVRMESLARRLPSELSGGQQQRVALARAIVTRPDVVLLDEPLSALDAALRHELRRDLRQVLSSVGATVILVTHDQEEAMTFAERVIVLNQGRIEQDGSPADLYDRPRNHFVAGFLGRANWLRDVHLVRRDGCHDHGRSRSGIELSLPHGSIDGRVDLCMRPERLFLCDAGARNAIPARVVECLHLGADRELTVESTDGQLNCLIRDRAQFVPSTGSSCYVGFEPGDAIVIASDTKSRTIY